MSTASTASESAEVTSLGSAAASAPSAAASAASTGDALVTSPRAWAIGTWRGAAVTTVVKLELPGNQGVQLAWVQDKGTTFVGPIDVNLELKFDGTLSGDVRGSLGELRLTGNWDAGGVVSANVSATNPAPDAFNGLLTLPLSTQVSSATAALRVVSNDGRWVRQAALTLVQSR